MLKHKRFKYPFTNALNRLKRKAKQEGWPVIEFNDQGFRFGYLKTKGRKWLHIVVLSYREGKYKPVTKRYKHSHFVKYH